MERTITLAQAQQRVDTYLETARAAISPRSTLVDENATPGQAPDVNPDTMACEDEAGQPLGTVNVGKQRRLQGLDGENRHGVYAAFRGWLAGNGFRVTSDNENSPQHQSVIAKNQQGFGITLDSVNGRYFLSASSPCVWRHGTPEPTP